MSDRQSATRAESVSACDRTGLAATIVSPSTNKISRRRARAVETKRCIMTISVGGQAISSVRAALVAGFRQPCKIQPVRQDMVAPPDFEFVSLHSSGAVHNGR